jgi:hypothetical protein
MGMDQKEVRDMHKFLMMATVLAGAAAAASGAHAAPLAALARPGAVVAAPVLDGGALAQPVQYYEDFRHREFRRREAYERFRRHEDWRRFRQAREGYGGGGYGRGYGGGYGRY